MSIFVYFTCKLDGTPYADTSSIVNFTNGLARTLDKLVHEINHHDASYPYYRNHDAHSMSSPMSEICPRLLILGLFDVPHCANFRGAFHMMVGFVERKVPITR